MIIRVTHNKKTFQLSTNANGKINIVPPAAKWAMGESFNEVKEVYESEGATVELYAPTPSKKECPECFEKLRKTHPFKHRGGILYKRLSCLSCDYYEPIETGLEQFVRTGGADHLIESPYLKDKIDAEITHKHQVRTNTFKTQYKPNKELK